MKQRQLVRQGRRVAIAACGLLMCAWSLQSCKDDDLLLTGQPSWLGNSIYERLEEDGQYKTLLRLVDDLEQKEVLSHTGSKTVFAANDSAFQVWFKNNLWGVSSYEQLTLAQKKLLFNNSMVNNAYLIELLSNVSANPPKEGMCMRRETATSIYDSVQVVSPDMMPNTPIWAKYRDNGKSIRLLKDATTPPMIHLLPAYMKFNGMTAKDLDVLTNHQASNINEAWVNGKRVVDRDITCKNGYIHKVDGVIESSPNMAEIIRTHSNMSMWSHLLDRFSAPYFDNAATKEFNRLYNNEDSVYVLRYYSKRSAGGQANETDPNKETVSSLLKFDPGWNQYMYSNTMNYDLHYDCGAMIVPTDEALEAWWNNEGRDLQSTYKTWDSIPDATISTLLNVNMFERFSSTFPSKFDIVLDDAMEPLGITPEDIDSCFMGCNGIIYMTNKVFMPAEFSSVAFPALTHDTLTNIIYWSLSGAEKAPSSSNFPFNYLPYLLSMDSYYSLLMPTNNAMKWYVDPVYYGQEDRETGMDAPTVLQFYYNKRKSLVERVQAYRYKTLIDEDGNITLGDRIQTEVSSDVIRDRLKRMVNDLIIVGDIEDGHEFYKTKGGSLIRVTKAPDGRLALSGGWQKEKNDKLLPINSDEIFVKKNGRTYQLNDQMPLTAQNSVYMTLKNHEEFFEFFELFDDENADMMSSSQSSYTAGLSSQGNKNVTLMDNYNYTVYVPTNESIRALISEGKLPTWDDYNMIGFKEPNRSEYKGNNAEEDYQEDLQRYERYHQLYQELGWDDETAYKTDVIEKVKTTIKDIIVNFLRYHIQDHSVAINMAPDIYEKRDDGTRVPLYTNAYESMTRNTKTSRFYPITVDNSNGQMTMVDATNNTHHVMKENGLYNLICREYWIQGDKSKTTATIYSSSDAVVHQIDSPLMYVPMTPWRNQLKEIGRN